jgi:hypothetical protein
MRGEHAAMKEPEMEKKGQGNLGSDDVKAQRTRGNFQKTG